MGETQWKNILIQILIQHFNTNTPIGIVGITVVRVKKLGK